MTAEREALIGYRLERASETLAEAELLAQAGHWNGCVNRLYYCCFCAVTALLLERGLSSPKHSGVRSLFNREFVKTGLVAQEMGEQLYNSLFQSRHRGDYDDLVRFDESLVRPWLGEARRFLSKMEALASRP